MNWPPLLRPWAPYLDFLKEEIAVSWAPMLPTLSHALGSLTTRTSKGLGEPDGYEGLSRKGSYERLLGSEWLLADEIPEEFLRRALMSEHLFFELAQQTKNTQRQLVVLFDAGPCQWGGPRLVQLALLMVFAQRALVQKARFQFGFLATPELPLLETINQRTLYEFLQARTAKVATPADVEAWYQQLANQVEPEFRFLVSSDPLVQTESRFAKVVIEENIEEQVKNAREQKKTGSVQVRVYSPRQSIYINKVHVELPPIEPSLQLFQNPFPRRQREASHFSSQERKPGNAATSYGLPDISLVFAPEHPRLFVSLFSKGLISYPLALHDKEELQPAPVVMVPPNGQPVLAVNWYKRNGFLVTRQEQNLRVYGVNRKGRIIEEKLLVPSKTYADCIDCFREAKPTSLQILSWLGTSEKSEGIFVDEYGFLTRLQWVDSTFTHVHHEQILAALSFRKDYSYVSKGHDELKTAFIQCENPLGNQGKLTIKENLVDFFQQASVDGEEKALYCFDAFGDFYTPRNIAYSIQNETWVFPEKGRDIPKISIDLQQNDQAIGLFWNQSKWLSAFLPEGPVFLVVDGTRQSLVLTNGKERESLVESAWDIGPVTISPRFGLLAYVNSAQELHVLYLHQRSKQFTYSLQDVAFS